MPRSQLAHAHEVWCSCQTRGTSAPAFLLQCERIKAACKQREEKLTRARRVVAEIEELCRQSRDDVRWVQGCV